MLSLICNGVKHLVLRLKAACGWVQVFAIREGKRYRLKETLNSKSLLSFAAGQLGLSALPESLVPASHA